MIPAVGIAPPHAERHTRWVRSTHWIGALAFLTLVVTGGVILMARIRHVGPEAKWRTQAFVPIAQSPARACLL